MQTLILTTLMSAATAAPSPSRLASGSHGAADDLNTSAVINSSSVSFSSGSSYDLGSDPVEANSKSESASESLGLLGLLPPDGVSAAAALGAAILAARSLAARGGPLHKCTIPEPQFFFRFWG